MFKDVKAWFSQSVDSNKQEKWRRNGGEIVTSFHDGDFIFSACAEAEDTKVIYGTGEYTRDSLCIFHPMYIAECARVGDRSEVAMGDYVLPPTTVQQMAKKQLGYQYKWDTPDAVPPTPPQNGEPTSHTNLQSLHPTTQPTNSADEEYVDIEALEQIDGDLVEFIPQGSRQCQVIMKS